MFHTNAGLFAERSESFKVTAFIKSAKWNTTFVTYEVWLNMTVAHFSLSALQFDKIGFSIILSVSILIFPNLLFGDDYLFSGVFVNFITVWPA